jgi:nucleotide-binding universal stress UspA family protein
MLREILVCLEGSPSTDAATRLAIDLARAQQASLAGLAIVDEPDIRAGAATSIGGSSFKRERDDALVAEARQRAQDALERFAATCRNAGVAARTLEQTGRPAKSILQAMETHDLTVIGRDANFRFELEETDAATRDAVLKRARRPVLLVPPDRAGSDGVVMVAFDGSGASKRAVAAFAESGLARGRQVHVATVDDNGAAAWEMAERATQMLRAADIPATTHNVVSPLGTADALLELRGKLDAGWLVMGAFARARIFELISGSVTRALVEQMHVPIYLCH